MDRTLDSVGSGYRLYIMGDLNGWIVDRTRVGITDAFGRRVVEFCEERGFCICNIF